MADGVIEKEGDDLVVRIPDEILDAAGIAIGDEVDVTVKNGRIEISKMEVKSEQ